MGEVVEFAPRLEMRARMSRQQVSVRAELTGSFSFLLPWFPFGWLTPISVTIGSPARA